MAAEPISNQPMNGIWEPDEETKAHLMRARGAFSRGEMEESLRHLMDGFLRAQSAAPRGVPLPAGWPEADEVTLGIARSLGGQNPPLASPDGPDVFVATRLYAVGGHTAVLNDYFRASGAERKHILLTGMAGDAGIGKSLRLRLASTADAVEVCPQPGRVDTMEWLLRRLRELSARRVFLFHHPEDVPAVAAVAGAGMGPCYLVHHADGAPSAGLHMPGFRILDLAPFPAWFSCRMLGLENLYLPLAVDDPGPPPPRPPNEWLRTCTHGSVIKFADDGPCAFSSIIPLVMATTGGTHLHVGPIDEFRRNLLREALEQQGIPPDRFVHLKQVPSLVPAMREHGVDLSLGSFPIGGARGHIDMMSGGIPHLTYLADPNHAPWKLHLLVPGARHWSTPEDLIRLLRAADAPWLAGQSALMRGQFLSRHNMADFRHRLRSLEEPGALPPIPAMPENTRTLWLTAYGKQDRIQEA